MKVCVIGLGYIGLPTAAILAANGFNVVGVDIDGDKLEFIKKGKTLYHENGLDVLLKASLKSENLKVKNKPEKADIFIICVSTPLNKESKSADLSYLISASKSVGNKLEKGNLVLIESTVPPGTTEKVVKEILENESNLKCSRDFYLAHSPERVLPGNLLEEMVKNNRIVGGIDEVSAAKAKELYSSFVKGNIIKTDVKTAEMAKLMENTYRAVNIALANEFALICEDIDVNIFDALRLANMHPRVDIHLPGPGVGGYCLPKDPWFITNNTQHSASLITTAMNINEDMPKHIINIIKKSFSEVKKSLDRSKIAVLGVAYKGNVSDSRGSPATPIIRRLLKLGSKVSVYDPMVKNYEYKIENDLNKAVNGSDAVIVITDHSKFKKIDWDKIVGLMSDNSIIVDTRNIVSPPNGAYYVGIGRCRRSQ